MASFIEKHLLSFLIVFFALLVCASMYSFFRLRIFNSCAFKLCEGMTDGTEDDDTKNVTVNEEEKKDGDDFKKYDTNDPNNALILAQQNAGNIMSLEQKIETQQAFVQRLDNLENTVENQQTQLDGLVEQQAQYAQDISASEPVEITGINEENTD
jgi:hypothetical protein